LLALFLYPCNILLAHGVPCTHVLLHARREAGFFAFGEGGTGLGDAALEAVFVEFLSVKSALVLYIKYYGLGHMHVMSLICNVRIQGLWEKIGPRKSI
jgi:hypothetical protein